MSTESNKKAAARFFDERWNQGNMSIYDEVRAPWPGLDDERAWVTRCLDACSRFALTVIAMVAEDDHVAVQFRSTAVFKEDLFDTISAGEEIRFDGIALLRFADGLIVEDKAYMNDPRILEFFRRI